jgi:hypothetical protein
MYESDQPLKIAELGDSIFIAESTKTPFSRLLKRGKTPNQMLAQWPVQKYPSRAFGGAVDGFDIDEFASTTRGTMEAYGMWMITEGWLVSKLANLTNAAGVGRDEKGKQAKDDALILARMIEQQLLSTMDTQLESKPATAYQSRGAFSWLSPTAQSTKPVPADYRPATACTYTDALASFLPANMETMLNAMATAKRGPVDLTGIVGISLKAQMSTWAQRDAAVSSSVAAVQSYNLNASEKKFMKVVDFFVFDAGEVRTIPSWFLANDATTGEATSYSPNSGLFVDLSMWELCFFQSPTGWMEPAKSGGPRGYHDAVYILKCMNPLGQGYVYTAT